MAGEHRKLYKQAYLMMVARKWKVLTDQGLAVPTLAHVQERGERLLEFINKHKTGAVDCGCFRARWNTVLGKAELMILPREYMDK